VEKRLVSISIQLT
jgi:hypothetical protein